MNILIFLALTSAVFSAVNAAGEVILYTQDNYKGDEFELEGLDKVGDCVNFWTPSGGYDPDLGKWSDKMRSIKLADGVCVRLYDGDCDWAFKGRTLDVYPFSNYLKSLAKQSFASITAGVERIECPEEPALVTLWSGINFKGDSFPLYELKKIGDCQELWNPAGYGVLISDDARRFNDRPQSVQLADGVCVRLNADQCDAPVRMVDVKPTSPWAKDLAIGAVFRSITSSVEMIECPIPSGVTLYKSNFFKGDKVVLDDLNKVGDCVDLWSPRGYQDHISDQYRWFNDATNSVKLEPGLCVRLYTDNCGAGRTLEDVCSDSKEAKNLSSKQFSGVSAVELTQANAPEPVAPPAPPPGEIIYIQDPDTEIWQ